MFVDYIDMGFVNNRENPLLKKNPCYGGCKHHGMGPFF